jgi:Rrf2 family protein
MKISDGVEWAAHACALLALLPEGVALNAAALAEFHTLPQAYMAKHMQALARAGVVTSVRGARGGYRLARPPSEVTMLDIRIAIEGPGPDFHCREIRRNGPCASRKTGGAPCTIAAAFWAAETAYRTQLQTVTVADIVADLARGMDEDRLERFRAWLGKVL